MTEHCYDSLASMALGVAPEAEVIETKAHMSECDECTKFYESLRPAANVVGYAAEVPLSNVDAAASTRLKASIMAHVRGEESPEKAASSAGGVRSIESAPSVRLRAPRPWGAYLVSAACFALLMVSFAQNQRLATENITLYHQVSDLMEGQTTTHAQVAALQKHLAALVAPNAKVYAIPSGEVVASSARIVVAVRDLPLPPAGKTYQVWSLKKGAKDMTPGATFLPEQNGVGVVEIPGDAGGIAAVAVSVEPDGGSRAPTSKPTFVRALT